MLKPELWNALNAIAALLSATVAYATVRLAVKNRGQDLASKRAYLTIKDPKIQAVPIDNTVKILIPIDNCGAHPASNVKLKIVTVDSSADSDPDFVVTEELANPIPGGTPTAYVNHMQVPKDCPEKLIAVLLSYKDSILGLNYSDTYYMRWSGIKNTEFQVNICHASPAEKDRLHAYLEKRRLS